MPEKIDFNDRMLSLGLARVSEAAALASARLIGRGDEKAADQAAVDAMRKQLNLLDIAGVVVIGEGERDEAPMLYIGEEVGTGKGPAVDIALDPLEGTTLTAKDMPNALAVIAMGPRGSMLHAPDTYMEKLAIGPGFAPGTVTLEMSPAERVAALAGVWPFFLLFTVIIGGLYAGLFTPTEAGGIGSGIALIVATLQRRMNGPVLKATLLETAYTSVMLYVVLFGAMLFSQLISFSGLADGLLSLVQGSGLSKLGVLLAILSVFLLLGCVMDTMAIILIFVPLFAPTLVAQGYDLIWFGIIVVVLTEIGLITPPIGMNVFVLKANLPQVPVGKIFKGLVPFIAVDVVRLALLVSFPAISLLLVRMMN